MSAAEQEQDTADLYAALDGLKVRVDDLVERLDWAEARRERLEHALAVAITVLHANISSTQVAALRSTLIQALEDAPEPQEAA